MAVVGDALLVYDAMNGQMVRPPIRNSKIIIWEGGILTMVNRAQRKYLLRELCSRRKTICNRRVDKVK